MTHRRSLLLAGLITLGMAGVAAAQGPFLDNKTLRIVVPFAAGGAQDAMARLIGTKLQARLGNAVIVDNKGGAGGIIGAETVARAEPDGATLLMATGGAITIAPNRAEKLPYDPVADFAAVALMADTPMTVAVRADSPYKNFADFLADARKRPGSVTYASTGPGTISNLTGELLALGTEVKLLHVPYRGAGPGITDLLGGRVDAMVTSTASIDPFILNRQARALASFTPSRLANLDGAPTIAEASGLKGLEVPVWVGLLAPAKTPAAAVDRLARELAAICAEPDTQERFAKMGAVATCGGPADLKAVIAADMDRWRTVVAKSGIKIE